MPCGGMDPRARGRDFRRLQLLEALFKKLLQAAEVVITPTLRSAATLELAPPVWCAQSPQQARPPPPPSPNVMASL